MVVMQQRYALRDEQWERLEQLGLPGQSGHVGVTAKDNRRFVEAVLYRFRAGIPWRDLPPHFGTVTACRDRTGIAYTFASTAGVSRAYGRRCSRSWRKNLITSMP